MLIGAVTGGIACGKSYVTSRFLEILSPAFASSFDCDVSVRELLLDPVVSRKVAELDPKIVFDPETGVLDKSKLRKLTFENFRFREKLEHLLHPLVLEHVKRRIGELGKDIRIALIEVPLLYESDFPLERDFDLVVAASLKTQEARLSENRQIEPTLAKRMIEAQMPMGKKINRGDIVVWNDGDIDSLEAQIQHLADRCAELLEK